MRLIQFFGIIAILFLPIKVSAQDVDVDYDHNTNFGQYRTFAFQLGRNTSYQGALDINNTQVENLIKDAITAKLAARGLQPSADNPDLIITYSTAIQEKSEVRSFTPVGYTYWGDGLWGPGYNEVLVTNYNEGTIIIDVIDAKNHQLIWRANCKDRVSNKPKKSMKFINKSMEEAFQKFPPEAGY
jgi:hypothetical protein